MEVKFLRFERVESEINGGGGGGRAAGCNREKEFFFAFRNERKRDKSKARSRPFLPLCKSLRRAAGAGVPGASLQTIRTTKPPQNSREYAPAATNHRGCFIGPPQKIEKRNGEASPLVQCA